MIQDTPVLIVGAGPTGLMLAAELARHQIHAMIIDKKETISRTSNALGIHSRTVDIWQDMGIAQQALAQGNPIDQFQVFDQRRRLAHLNLTTLATQFPFTLVLPQFKTEALLEKHLADHYHITVQRGLTCCGLEEKSNHIVITCQDKQQQVHTLTCQWLVACDGAHSQIRELTHTPFIGPYLQQRFIMADCDIDWPVSQHTGSAFLAKDGPMFVAAFKDYYRIIFDVTHQDNLYHKADLSLSDFQTLASKRCLFPIKLSNPIWLTRFGIPEKQISTYRKGHIFFAGDAAHTHSPVGGQGLNTGAQDAHNLAWKLAYVIHGYANEKLLDTYETERYPIAQGVLKGTTLATKLITTHNPVKQWIRNKVIAYWTKIPHIKQRMLEKLTQINIHYKQGFLTLLHSNGFSHHAPKPGYRPIISTTHFSTIHIKTWVQIMQFNQFKLLLFLPTQSHSDEVKSLVSTMQTHYRQHMALYCISRTEISDMPWAKTCILDTQHQWYRYFGCRKGGVYLLRPDNIIAYRHTQFNADVLLNLLHAYLY